MALKPKTNVTNVTQERARVAALIAQARATEAALASAEFSLDTLDTHVAAFSAK